MLRFNELKCLTHRSWPRHCRRCNLCNRRKTSNQEYIQIHPDIPSPHMDNLVMNGEQIETIYSVNATFSGLVALIYIQTADFEVFKVSATDRQSNRPTDMTSHVKNCNDA